MFDCPVCKNRDVREAVCRRCKADLGMLVALHRRRRRCLAECARHIRLGQADEASLWLDEATALKQDTDTDRLAALLHLLEGDFALALHHGRRAANII